MSSLLPLTGSSLSGFSSAHGKVSLGTSIIAITFKDGVVMAADTRTSTGIYVANRHTDKIGRLTENIYVCQSGSAADTEAISDAVSHYMAAASGETSEMPRVRTAAKLVSGFIYPNKEHLQAGMIIGGFDKHEGGQVYSVTIGGTLNRQDWVVSGSGSIYIYGMLDESYRKDMSEEEALEFVVNALSFATFRDGYSGGFIRTAVIKSSGVTRRSFDITDRHQSSHASIISMTDQTTTLAAS